MRTPSTRTPSTRTLQALAQVQPPWDAERTERNLRALPALRRKKHRQQVVRRGLALTLLLGPLLWLGVARQGESGAEHTVASHTGAAAAAAAATGDSRQLRLADGSSVALLETSTDVAVEHVDERLVALHLRAGHARFEVTRRPERVFRVRTAEVTVEVLGTIFEVEQRALQTRVQVTRGRVAVLWGNQRHVLTAGGDRLFPPAAKDEDPLAARSVLQPAERASVPAPRHEPAAVESAQPAGTSSARARRSARAQARAERAESQSAEPQSAEPQNTSWRDHAEGGDFKSAFPLLPQTDKMATMSVSDLMLAADAARLSGHPRAALPFLTRVVEAHAEDARAPLAAFTLGGVLMHQLGLPREAEAAYEKARSSTQSAALAQDALARQVEAASRAGDEALARKLARAYLEQYPDGRRVNAVRRFGRL